MKNLVVMVCFALAISCSAAAQNVSPTDYTVPVSTAEQMRVDGSYNYAGTGSNTTSNDASAALFYSRYFNSLPYAYDLNLNVLGDTHRQADDTQEENLNAVFSSGIRKYLQDDGNWFYSLELNSVYDDDFDRPSIETVPGIGYGRFIRATALARAVRVVEFLKEEGVVRGDLPKATMIELGHIIEREDEYRDLHGERYRRYWFEDMEKVIAETGMFTGDGLGAVGVLRTDEVLFDERINERFYGWDVRFGVRAELLSEFNDVDTDDPGAAIRARYSRPLGWKSQISLSAESNSPFTGDFGDVHSTRATVNYIYEIGNRIDFTLSDILIGTKSNPDLDTQLSNQIRSGFIFYLENRVNLSLTTNVTMADGQRPTQGLNLAFGYRLK